MPLIDGYSSSAVSENIRQETDAGKPHDQAVAIALENARRAKDRRHRLAKLLLDVKKDSPTVSGVHVPSADWVEEALRDRRRTRRRTPKNRRKELADAVYGSIS